MENFLKDVRHGLRLLARNPAHSVIAILALTAGIGLTTTMFSIVYGALFRGLPFEDPHRIIHVERSNLPRGQTSLEVPIHDYRDWRAQQRSFEHLGAFYFATVNLSGTERPERLEGAYMTANAFSVLRVRPHLGRLFREEDELPGAQVVLIGYRDWETRFNADPEVVGKAVRVNGEPATIVGVLPDQFMFPERQQIWLPLRLDPLKIPRGGGRTMEVFGRLRDGATIEEARADLDAVARRLEQAWPAANKDIRPVLKPFVEEYIGDEPRTLLFTMMGAVFFVLLIACTNVANLLLGRAILRNKEVGIRTALGASRWRLVTQFLTEAMVLSTVGALLGLVLAFIGIRMFNNAIAISQPPAWIIIKLDGIALAFTFGLTALTTAFSGIIPALQASRAQVTDVLKDESRGSSSFRLGRVSRGLVVFEIALSCGLLVAAGLTIKSVVKLRNVDLGFDASNIFTARLTLDEVSHPDAASFVQFYETLLPRLQSQPGVKSLTLASSLPGVGEGEYTFGIDGVNYDRDQDYPTAVRTAVMPGYFELLGIKPLEGRDLNGGDRADALPVIVVNRSFARKFFPDQSAVGRRIRLGNSQSTRPWMTVVGIVPDATAGELGDSPPEAMYVPFAQNAQRSMSIVARTQGEALSIVSGVRSAVAAQNADLPVYDTRDLRNAIAARTWFYRVFGVLFMIFGIVALLLASIGLYAVMAFSVSQRTREVGIRMAVGAQARDVLGMIMRQGLVQVALGMLFGLAFALFVSRLLSIILFDVQPRDPLIFGSIALVLVFTALMACLVPARRATSVHPVEALRYE